MLNGTLTRRAADVSSDLGAQFGCSFCREDVNPVLARFSRAYRAARAALEQSLGPLSDADFLARLAQNRGMDGVRAILDDRAALDEALEALAELDSVYIPLPTNPDGYRAAFDAHTRSADRPDAPLFATTREWNANLWQTLLALRREYLTPAQHMRRIVDRLGHPAFADDPLALRILKQLLLCVDFTGTGIALGPLAACNRGEESARLARLAALDESLFAPPAGYDLPPMTDLRAMLRVYHAALPIVDPSAEAALLACLTPACRADYRADDEGILAYLHRTLAAAERPEACLAVEPEAARAAVKAALRAAIDHFGAGKKLTLDRVNDKYAQFVGKPTAAQRGSYLLKLLDRPGALPGIEAFLDEAAVAALREAVDRHAARTAEQGRLDRIARILAAKSRLWRTVGADGSETDDALHCLLALPDGAAFPGAASLLPKLIPLCPGLDEAHFVAALRTLPADAAACAAALEGDDAACSAAADAFAAYTDRIRADYAVKAGLSACNRSYHDLGGQWTLSAQEGCDLIPYCRYLASGGTADLDPVFAKTALYLFAFAFDLTYYPTRDGDYDPHRDLEKLLFRSFYADNLLHFVDSAADGYRREPSGVGINAKNYRECIYLYFLNRRAGGRDRFRAACALCRTVAAREGEPTDADTEVGTRIYREERLPALLRLPDEAALADYITAHYTISRRDRSASVLRIGDDSRSAYAAYSAIMEKLRLLQSRDYGVDGAAFEALLADRSRVRDGLPVITPWLSVAELEEALLATPAAESADFVRLVRLALERLDRRNLLRVTPENVTRTTILTAYFHYFCQSMLGSEKSLADVFSFFSGVDRYLTDAGMQPLSPKNIFDMLTVIFAYGYINYALV